MVSARLAGDVPGGAMPVEFLTAEQVAAYDQWIGPTSRAQRERCLVLDTMIWCSLGAANDGSILKWPGRSVRVQPC
jgi:hypothetical protein